MTEPSPKVIEYSTFTFVGGGQVGSDTVLLEVIGIQTDQSKNRG